MKGSRTDIEEKIAQKLRDHAVSPPPQVWANVEKALGQPAKSERPFWLLDAGALLIWLMLTISFGNGALTPTVANNQVTNPSVGETLDENANIHAVELSERSGSSSYSTQESSEKTPVVSEEKVLPETMAASHHTSPPRQKETGNTSPKTGVNRDSKIQKPLAADKTSSSQSILFVNEESQLANPLLLEDEVNVSEESEPRSPEQGRFVMLQPRRPWFNNVVEMGVLSPLVGAVTIDRRLPGDIKKHMLFLGAHGLLNLSSIFNQNTRGAFLDKELPYKPTLGYAGGIRLGYNYMHRYGFETGALFSKQGQYYEGSIGGKQAARQVDLTYVQVPLVLRYTFGNAFKKKTPSPWVIGLGAQLGILVSASEKFDGNETDLADDFTIPEDYSTFLAPIEVAGVLALDKEIYFHKHMFVSLGLRVTFSSDMNAEGYPAPDAYGKSHNFMFGLNVSFNGFLEK